MKGKIVKPSPEKKTISVDVAWAQSRGKGVVREKNLLPQHKEAKSFKGKNYQQVLSMEKK